MTDTEVYNSIRPQAVDNFDDHALRRQLTLQQSAEALASPPPPRADLPAAPSNQSDARWLDRPATTTTIFSQDNNSDNKNSRHNGPSDEGPKKYSR